MRNFEIKQELGQLQDKVGILEDKHKQELVSL